MPADPSKTHLSGKANDVQVVVVGFGPAGALAANLLGQAGIRTLCVDRSREVYGKPRAIALDHEILRILDNIGVAEAVSPHIAPFDLSEHFGVDGGLLRRIGMVGTPYPLGYTPTMVFTQPPLEAALREHARRWQSLEVRLGTQVTAIVQDEHGVALELRDAAGSVGRVTADYVIACDGASSSLRGMVGLTLDDLDFDEPWVVIDLKVDADKLGRLPANSAHYCEPTRPAVYIVGPGNHRRWEIMLLDGEDPREMERPERVWQLLSRWLGPDDAILWRAASYRFHALVLREWGRGRVFFAGDAAHQQPPILGQGMCQGMRDATNLVWKLQAVIASEADRSLLDSYGEERSLHVRELIEQIKQIGAVLCERDPDEARKRDARILAESGGVPATITRQSVIPPLRAGLLSDSARDGTGSLFPQPRVMAAAGEGLLDRVCGTGWRLVIDAESQRWEQDELVALSDASRGLGITVLALTRDAESVSPAIRSFGERDGILAGWFADHAASAVLVRPDHYVFGTGDAAVTTLALIAELGTLLRPAAGALPSQRTAAA
ncbi:bifunctional 3-(3-hydroxy-phenyl)propionate/3-hydroxycinnamic acid hydroxylase (plasmid) [Bosea sp. F3-2]|uniref:bifunctional 3-(3-hydroxy-phenyl)propionate/3-hydroxycinnamic acid hydroxylase n=1 Tax=Bosea sp. F3-2 TaxID=2599640 RepID=UPI0011EFC806|nr:bifunctional 3-(3-hydroxy-phenyl)propionate/3-hydroxycinnamic acid hydroxylase [Bosea sp. F3-2]QEL27019.1 bifunctional 3-(3-hydroxy-phenyl)propionate/3-hydroxycinnamic acid hydroxylase [Bosea sp. F3-2]